MEKDYISTGMGPTDIPLPPHKEKGAKRSLNLISTWGSNSSCLAQVPAQICHSPQPVFVADLAHFVGYLYHKVYWETYAVQRSSHNLSPRYQTSKKVFLTKTGHFLKTIKAERQENLNLTEHAHMATVFKRGKRLRIKGKATNHVHTTLTDVDQSGTSAFAWAGNICPQTCSWHASSPTYEAIKFGYVAD